MRTRQGQNPKPPPMWTLAELSARAIAALSADYEGQSNGQVRELPSQRAIRFYTTLGLLDRPAAMRGRTALYGRRHLLQIVSVKRLQARGLPLSQVQAELLALDDRSLAELARLPEDLEKRVPAARPGGDQPKAERQTSFWTAAPAPVAAAASPPSAPRLQSLPLGLEAVLIFLGTSPSAEDLQDLQRAARPLLKLLKRFMGSKIIERNKDEPTA